MFIYSGVGDSEKMKQYIASLTEEDKLELQRKVKEVVLRDSKIYGLDKIFKELPDANLESSKKHAEFYRENLKKKPKLNLSQATREILNELPPA